ncbi:hypothetical protein HYPSUDRAFT_40831 [Hypholoma sublateritium FD-334 SS-4]|uniref:Protein kinase domain-containing protein n=1 Tax=Hypholoma sublateritium (strain FD-334 SS-4) TaxID=945553 RepID=A0A0D2P216_HYPSF|nr:hypothetical protein HYPSUDRAFT_40831 [Hypholoma sublateritium FD-334 SS-4]
MNASEGSTTLSTEDHRRFFCAGRPETNINQRYKLVGRLGTGRRSIVWLAEDINPRKWRLSRFVAIKILSAEATQAQSVMYDELFIIKHVLRRLADQGPLHPARKYFPVFFDKVTMTDNLGTHFCLAMEPLITFWAGIRGPFRALSVALTKSATRQLLTALRFLHEECGVVHRDIRSENLLVSLTTGDMSLHQYDARARMTSRPGKIPGSTAVLGGLPLSVPSTPSDYFDVMDHSNTLVHNIKITGFGSAIIEGSLPSSEPAVHCGNMSAPEIILGNTSSFGTDIWSLGCLVYELITGYPLFEFPPDNAGHHLQLMQEMAEQEFEIPYIRQGRNFAKYFHTYTNTPRTEVEDPPNIGNCLHFHSWIAWKDVDDKKDFIDFFLSMMHLHPSDRGTAAELLEHRWLQS